MSLVGDPVVAAGLVVFATHSYHGSSTRMISKGAGRCDAIVNARWGSKIGLFNTIVCGFFKPVEERRSEELDRLIDRGRWSTADVFTAYYRPLFINLAKQNMPDYFSLLLPQLSEHAGEHCAEWLELRRPNWDKVCDMLGVHGEPVDGPSPLCVLSSIDLGVAGFLRSTFTKFHSSYSVDQLVHACERHLRALICGVEVGVFAPSRRHVDLQSA